MQPSTAPTQAPPAHARMTQSSPAAPSRGVPGGFGHVLTQALAAPEPAGAAEPASPAPTETTASPAQALPALPAVAAAPQADPAAIDPSKPEKDGTAASAHEAKEDKSSVEAAKPSEELQAPASSQPILPAPPQAAPPQAAPMVTQPVATPSEDGDATPSTGQDSSTAPVAGIDGREPPSASAPAAAQTAASPASAPPSHAAAPSEASDTAAHAVQKHFGAVVAEKEPSAASPAIPAEAASPLPVASASLPSIAPAPLGVAPHSAPAPPQAPARSTAAEKPALPSAAVQVGPVLASFAAGVAHSGAPQHLTIRLDPMDLGRVQVRIERSPDGSARVDLKVEKPDTLLLLLRDQPQLHRALDLAGVPSSERTLQFHLAPPDAPAPGAMAAQSNADGGHGQHRPGQPHSGRFAAHGAPSLGESIPGPAVFRRAGVDITA